MDRHSIELCAISQFRMPCKDFPVVIVNKTGAVLKKQVCPDEGGKMENEVIHLSSKLVVLFLFAEVFEFI